MILVELPLASGNHATFFLTTNFTVSANKEKPSHSILSDGVHNNGGWSIAMCYRDVIKKISVAMKE